MKQQKKVAELLWWTVLAIILGLVISFAFLPLLGVNPIESLKIMLSETFADKFSMGNILMLKNTFIFEYFCDFDIILRELSRKQRK